MPVSGRNRLKFSKVVFIKGGRHASRRGKWNVQE